MLKGFSAWRQPALETVTLARLFAKKGLATRASVAQHKPKQLTPALCKFLLRRTFERLERHIEAVKPNPGGNQTTWANYVTARNHYNDADLAVKSAFVRQALDESTAQTVLDLGCNAGEFSHLAASQGKRVVAADFDEGALTSLYAALRLQPDNISPILLDVGWPTPAIGWMNREIPSFLDRAKGKFDCVMALGLIHHLLATERIPLQLILQLIEAIAPRTLIIEWIDPSDSRFVEIAGLNGAYYKQLCTKEFETLFEKSYRLVRKQGLPSCGSRILYHWVR